MIRFSLLLVAAVLVFIHVCMPVFANIHKSNQTNIQKQLAALEVSSNGRIGLYAINTENNTDIQYRANERFPFCSTSKVMVVSAILKQSMTNAHLLEQKVIYTKENLLSAGYTPITQKHLANDMTISGLCAAAIEYSDNAAMNFLVKELGGPKAVTAFARSIGDKIFRLDRIEPKLNSAVPGDLRDTTTPAAMEKSLQKLVLGNVLGLPQRELLQIWLKNNTTGDFRIRAGVPKGWLVGDKTGTGQYGTTNDIGIIWPPKCSPIVVVIYFTQQRKEAAPRDDIIASTTRLLISAFAKTDPCLKQ